MSQADLIKATVKPTKVTEDKKKLFDNGFKGKNIAAQQAKIDEDRRQQEQIEAAKVYADFVRNRYWLVTCHNEHTLQVESFGASDGPNQSTIVVCVCLCNPHQ